jgi:hypothetical protein
VRHLGSLVLASLLLGVPRALEGRAFGAGRTVCVEVSPDAPDLLAFRDALERALCDAAWTLVPRRAAGTTVIEVHGVRSTRDAHGRRQEAVALTVSGRGRTRRVMASGEAGRRDEIARVLLAGLSPGDC